MANRKDGNMWDDYEALLDPSGFPSTQWRKFFWTGKSLASSYQKTPPFPGKFTWQHTVAAIHNQSPSLGIPRTLRPESLSPRAMRAPALGAVLLWLLKPCWVSRLFTKLASLWESYIIRNQGAQSTPAGHWGVLWVTGRKKSRSLK